MVWSDEQVEFLLARFAENVSSSDIAAQLNISRNAVIGKLHRLGLSRSPESRAQLVRPLQPERPKAGTGCGGQPIAHKPNESIGEQQESILSPDMIPLQQRKTILELKQHHCRFPYGIVGQDDFFFCGGDAVVGLPYCDVHARIAYRAPGERQSRRYLNITNAGNNGAVSHG